jgi:hypothetical protein
MNPQTAYHFTRCQYICFCLVSADGTFDYGPMGWTCARTGVGTYVFTHDIGHGQYMPLPRAIAAADFRVNATISEMTDNTVTVSVYDSTQLADSGFALMVVAA